MTSIKSEHQTDDIRQKRLKQAEFLNNNATYQKVINSAKLKVEKLDAKNDIAYHLTDEEIKKKIKVDVKKVFQLTFITDLVNSKQQIIELQPNDDKKAEKLQYDNEIKLCAEKNKLIHENLIKEMQNAQLKEQLTKLQKQFFDYQKLRKEGNEQHHSIVVQLKSQLQKSNKENQKLKKQMQQQDQNINNQRKQIIKNINQFLGKKTLKIINENQRIFLSTTSEDLIASVEELKIILVENQDSLSKERQFLNKVLAMITENFKQIQTDQFSCQKFIQQKITLFKKSTQTLRTKIIDNSKLNIPNQQFYVKLVDLFTLVDSKVNEILLNWNNQLTQAKSSIQTLKKQSQELKDQIVEKDQKYAKLESDSKNIKLQLQRQVKVLNDNINKINLQKNSLEDNLQKLSAELEKQKNNLRAKQTQIKQLQNEISTKITQSNRQKEQIKQKNNTIISGLNKNISQLKDKLQQYLKKLQKQTTQLKDKITFLQQQLIKEKQIAAINTQKNNQLSNQNQHLLKNTIKLMQKQIDDQKIKITELQQEILTTTKKYKQQQKQNYQFNNIIKQQQSQIYILNQKPKQIRCYTQYFNGNILNYQNVKQTEWFVSLIENYSQNKIKATKLLYRCDPKNINSLHNYIDGHPNLVVIIRHINGQVIGAFSQPALQKNVNCSFKKGMMVGFKNQKILYVKKQHSSVHNKTDPRPLTWDDSYIIFGNSDLRIKQSTPAADDLQIYSNYGTTNCSFENPQTKNSSVQDLFNDAQRKSKYLDYEVYSIIFQ